MKKTAQKSQLKSNLAKVLLTICKAMPTFITIVAIISTIVYLCTYFEVTTRVWYLPLLAGVTGLTALILPALAKVAKPLWSVVSTGITLFVMQILPEWMFTVYVVFALICLIATFSDACVHGSSNLSWGNAIFNSIISCISALIIFKVENELATAIILLIVYLITLIVDFNFQFSIKRSTHKVKVKKETPIEQPNDNKSESPDIFITPPEDYVDISSK